MGQRQIALGPIHRRCGFHLGEASFVESHGGDVLPCLEMTDDRPLQAGRLAEAVPAPGTASDGGPMACIDWLHHICPSFALEPALRVLPDLK